MCRRKPGNAGCGIKVYCGIWDRKETRICRKFGFLVLSQKVLGAVWCPQVFNNSMEVLMTFQGKHKDQKGLESSREKSRNAPAPSRRGDFRAGHGQDKG